LIGYSHPILVVILSESAAVDESKDLRLFFGPNG